METLFQDVRYAFRTLSRSRMFALIAVTCLAIGIGVDTTIFSVTNAILLRPFAFTDPERLVVLGELDTKNEDDAGVSWPNLVDWRSQSMASPTSRGADVRCSRSPTWRSPSGWREARLPEPVPDAWRQAGGGATDPR